MKPRFAAVVLSVLPASVPLASTIAQAGPSRTGDSTDTKAAPLIGRAQMRDGVFDLTRETLSEGGPAHALAPGVAHVMAEAAAATERMNSRTEDHRHR
jgi:hypothetical protein